MTPVEVVMEKGGGTMPHVQLVLVPVARDGETVFRGMLHKPDGWGVLVWDREERWFDTLDEAYQWFAER